MKLIDAKGREISIQIKPSDYPVKKHSRSSLQGKTGEFLLQKYPYAQLLEDWTIPGSRMSLDFYAPSLYKAWEVNGKQHSSFIGRFHGERNKLGFAKQKIRDVKKAKFCSDNNIELIIIETEEDLNNI